MVEFPQEPRRIASLEARLSIGDLTLEEIQEIEGQLVRTDVAAASLFGQLEKAKSRFQKKQIGLSERAHALSQEINKVDLEWDESELQDLSEKIIDLSQRVFGLFQEESESPYVQTLLQDAKRHLEDLNFRFVFPIVSELDEHSLAKTFARDLKEMSFQELSPIQKMEIVSHTGTGPMTPEMYAQGTEDYLQQLNSQVDVAKDFFFGRIEEGMEHLLALPNEVRQRVDQLIFEKTGGEPIDPTDERSALLITGAIMYSLEERMGF